MAIDTKEKRAGILGVGRPWARTKNPTADKDEQWRIASGFAYGGNALSAYYFSGETIKFISRITLNDRYISKIILNEKFLTRRTLSEKLTSIITLNEKFISRRVSVKNYISPMKSI